MTEGRRVREYGHAERDPGSHRYLAPYIVELCKAHGVKLVLDLGCGNGALCRELHMLGIQAVGVEPSADGVNIARKLNPDIRFYRMGVSGRPSEIKENGFDMVVSAEVVEHLYEPELLPAFASEKLRPRGLLIVTTPYHGYFKNLCIAMLGKWDSHHQPQRTGGHIKFWSAKTLRDLLTGQGFTVEKVVGVGRVPYLWKSMIVVARKAG